MSDFPTFAELVKSPLFHEHFTRRAGAHAELNLERLSVDTQSVSMRLPFDAKLARNAEALCTHSGAILTAIDSAMGLAVMMQLEKPSGLATLELRYDEVTPPRATCDVRVQARCERIEDALAYVTASAWDHRTEPFAHATARFILTGESSAFMERAMQMLAGTS